MYYWLVYNFFFTDPRQKKIWVKVRFVHETEKAVLVLFEGRKTWIAKSRIDKIRLRKGDFEVYVWKSMVG